ncbi:M23 family metallopeptidase [Pseudoflavonifractor phocaeensis]|uniref:M23 family metallopeptidase n=1 Tax=Pseudoflavonifractor phocaeensis TaxID=1870988 RepID=UPI00210A5DCD|nr:M23 family metallopeptidase [Pseudoflavonifractor phocaeensis]MCQ4864274.1 M23 family metallopeptidase [Pseudoflavonifractor phocaeensis]
MESAYRDWERQRTNSAGRHTASRRGTKVALGPRECRRLAQLGICVVLFLVVFIGKGVFPEQMVAAREQITGLISGDTDFRAAFASLGKSISDGEPVLETLGGLWVDVFGGGQRVEVDTWQPSALYEKNSALIGVPATAAGILALDLSKTELPAVTAPVQAETPPEETAQPVETTPSQAEPAEPAVVDMGYTGEALPANASMDKYSLGVAQTMSPIQGAEGAWVSSGYGWREHPVDGGEKFHNGVDLAVNDGTHVKAFADGTVDYIGESPIYGLYTQIDHGNGVTTFYAHCGKLLVQQGQSVKMGDVIAESGETGNATGPHLHFEIKKDGVLLNPLYYIETP